MNKTPFVTKEQLDEIMKTYFPDIVDIDFTANMEKRLDIRHRFIFMMKREFARM